MSFPKTLHIAWHLAWRHEKLAYTKDIPIIHADISEVRSVDELVPATEVNIVAI
jgi:hypothetical protein